MTDNPQDSDRTVDTCLIEYLTSSAGWRDGGPVAVITVRLTPESSFESVNLAITKTAAKRLSEDLRRLLTAEGSWLCG